MTEQTDVAINPDSSVTETDIYDYVPNMKINRQKYSNESYGASIQPHPSAKRRCFRDSYFSSPRNFDDRRSCLHHRDDNNFINYKKSDHHFSYRDDSSFRSQNETEVFDIQSSTGPLEEESASMILPSGDGENIFFIQNSKKMNPVIGNEAARKMTIYYEYIDHLRISLLAPKERTNSCADEYCSRSMPSLTISEYEIDSREKPRIVPRCISDQFNIAEDPDEGVFDDEIGNQECYNNPEISVKTLGSSISGWHPISAPYLTSEEVNSQRVSNAPISYTLTSNSPPLYLYGLSSTTKSNSDEVKVKSRGIDSGCTLNNKPRASPPPESLFDLLSNIRWIHQDKSHLQILMKEPETGLGLKWFHGSVLSYWLFKLLSTIHSAYVLDSLCHSSGSDSHDHHEVYCKLLGEEKTVALVSLGAIMLSIFSLHMHSCYSNINSLKNSYLDSLFKIIPLDISTAVLLLVPVAVEAVVHNVIQFSHWYPGSPTTLLGIVSPNHSVESSNLNPFIPKKNLNMSLSAIETNLATDIFTPRYLRAPLSSNPSHMDGSERGYYSRGRVTFPMSLSDLMLYEYLQVFPPKFIFECCLFGSFYACLTPCRFVVLVGVMAALTVVEILSVPFDNGLPNIQCLAFASLSIGVLMSVVSLKLLADNKRFSTFSDNKAKSDFLKLSPNRETAFQNSVVTNRSSIADLSLTEPLLLSQEIPAEMLQQSHAAVISNDIASASAEIPSRSANSLTEEGSLLQSMSRSRNAIQKSSARLTLEESSRWSEGGKLPPRDATEAIRDAASSIDITSLLGNIPKELQEDTGFQKLIQNIQNKAQIIRRIAETSYVVPLVPYDTAVVSSQLPIELLKHVNSNRHLKELADMYATLPRKASTYEGEINNNNNNTPSSRRISLKQMAAARNRGNTPVCRQSQNGGDSRAQPHSGSPLTSLSRIRTVRSQSVETKTQFHKEGRRSMTFRRRKVSPLTKRSGTACPIRTPDSPTITATKPKYSRTVPESHGNMIISMSHGNLLPRSALPPRKESGDARSQGKKKLLANKSPRLVRTEPSSVIPPLQFSDLEIEESYRRIWIESRRPFTARDHSSSRKLNYKTRLTRRHSERRLRSYIEPKWETRKRGITYSFSPRRENRLTTELQPPDLINLSNYNNSDLENNRRSTIDIKGNLDSSSDPTSADNLTSKTSSEDLNQQLITENEKDNLDVQFTNQPEEIQETKINHPILDRLKTEPLIVHSIGSDEIKFVISSFSTESRLLDRHICSAEALMATTEKTDDSDEEDNSKKQFELKINNNTQPEISLNTQIISAQNKKLSPLLSLNQKITRWSPEVRARDGDIQFPSTALENKLSNLFKTHDSCHIDKPIQLPNMDDESSECKMKRSATMAAELIIDPSVEDSHLETSPLLRSPTKCSSSSSFSEGIGFRKRSMRRNFRPNGRRSSLIYHAAEYGPVSLSCTRPVHRRGSGGFSSERRKRRHLVDGALEDSSPTANEMSDVGSWREDDGEEDVGSSNFPRELRRRYDSLFSSVNLSFSDTDMESNSCSRRKDGLHGDTDDPLNKFRMLPNGQLDLDAKAEDLWHLAMAGKMWEFDVLRASMVFSDTLVIVGFQLLSPLVMATLPVPVTSSGHRQEPAHSGSLPHRVLVIRPDNFLDGGNLSHCEWIYSYSPTSPAHSRLKNFLWAIQSNYYFTPYHNQLHGTACANGMAFLLHCLELDDDPLETAGLVVAAICHDVGHPGRNNTFIINTYDHLSLIYNDISVLENYHAYLTFRTLEATDSDVFQHVTDAAFRSIRKLMIDAILSTDMKKHFESVAKYQVLLKRPDFDPKKNPDDRSLVQGMCIKVADVGHALLGWDQHFEWSCRINEELYRQGDDEKRLMMTVSPLCDRSAHAEMPKGQVSFLTFVVRPLVQQMSYLDSKKKLAILMENLSRNNEAWQQMLESQDRGTFSVVQWPDRLKDIVLVLTNLEKDSAARPNQSAPLDPHFLPSASDAGGKTRSSTTDSTLRRKQSVDTKRRTSNMSEESPYSVDSFKPVGKVTKLRQALKFVVGKTNFRSRRKSNLPLSEAEHSTCSKSVNETTMSTHESFSKNLSWEDTKSISLTETTVLLDKSVDLISSATPLENRSQAISPRVASDKNFCPIPSLTLTTSTTCVPGLEDIQIQKRGTPSPRNVDSSVRSTSPRLPLAVAFSSTASSKHGRSRATICVQPFRVPSVSDQLVIKTRLDSES